MKEIIRKGRKRRNGLWGVWAKGDRKVEEE